MERDTFFLFGLLLEFKTVIQLDKQEGFELGFVVVDTLQLSDLQAVLRDVLLLAVLHGGHSGHGFQPGLGQGSTTQSECPEAPSFSPRLLPISPARLHSWSVITPSSNHGDFWE